MNMVNMESPWPGHLNDLTWPRPWASVRSAQLHYQVSHSYLFRLTSEGVNNCIILGFITRVKLFYLPKSELSKVTIKTFGFLPKRRSIASFLHTKFIHFLHCPVKLSFFITYTLNISLNMLIKYELEAVTIWISINI